MDGRKDNKKVITENKNKGSQIEEDVEKMKVRFAAAILDKVIACAVQEDSPIYEGDKEVDNFVRLSDVESAINECLDKNIVVEENNVKVFEVRNTDIKNITEMEIWDVKWNDDEVDLVLATCTTEDKANTAKALLEKDVFLDEIEIIPRVKKFNQLIVGGELVKL